MKSMPLSSHIKFMLIFSGALLLSGCGLIRSTDYTPELKQAFEDIESIRYANAPFSNTRLVYMHDKLWLQYNEEWLLEARILEMVVNDTNATKINKYLLLPSDHPLGSYSNMLFDVNFLLDNTTEVKSLTYRVYQDANQSNAKAVKELKEQTLSIRERWTLERFLKYVKNSRPKVENNASKSDTNSTVEVNSTTIQAQAKDNLELNQTK
jgi:hypothetical protein